MPEAARLRAPSGRPLPRVRRRLAQLLATRLVLATVVLAAALTLIGVGEQGEGGAERGLYATVAAAFLISALFAALLASTRGGRGLGGAQLAADVGLVTALVHFSGGSESIFAFLYLPITVYAALLFGRPGAYGGSALSALAFGALLLARHHGYLASHGAPAPPAPVQLLLWGTNAGALLLVALLASMLARELDRAGRALHERTRDLRSLRWLHERTVESLTSGLVTVDTTGRITSFNPEAVRITGCAVADALGRPLDRVIPGALEAVCTTLDARDSRGRLRTRLRIPRKSGGEQHLGLSGSVLRHEDGTPSGHVVIFQDVTRIVEMERELRRRERLAVAGRLAASLAHEIRNPLAAISGSLQILRHAAEQGRPDPEAPRLMGIVLRETERLDALITDFLEYARPGPARPRAVRVAEPVEDVRRMLESACPSEVSVRVDVPSDLVVRADASQLRQLLWNLVRNALEAMPKGGELRLAARPCPAQEPPGADRNGAGEGPAWAEIAVADTGVGIAEEAIDRIFEPFFTSKPEGTGLGLATVHRIVEDNLGQLSVESSVGGGTTFRIRLPRLEPPR